MKLVVNNHYKHEYFVPQITCTSTPTAFPAGVSPVSNPENIFVQAHPQNTKNIIIGKSDVLANGTKGGYILAPGSNMNLPGGRGSAYFHVQETSGTTLMNLVYQRAPM